MILFLVTFGLIAFLVLIMAIGVMFGRKPIAGSCGGYDALHLDCAAGCKTPCAKRRAAQARAKEASLPSVQDHVPDL
ncbi:MAG: (Na+)-NQR maturation NqrM [Zoogloeaceae bacterium]|nr:(Na+)-NQR maturation NqrM [Zoogloeaceae bacterium]